MNRQTRHILCTLGLAAALLLLLALLWRFLRRRAALRQPAPIALSYAPQGPAVQTAAAGPARAGRRALAIALPTGLAVLAVTGGLFALLLRQPAPGPGAPHQVGAAQPTPGASRPQETIEPAATAPARTPTVRAPAEPQQAGAAPGGAVEGAIPLPASANGQAGAATSPASRAEAVELTGAGGPAADTTDRAWAGQGAALTAGASTAGAITRLPPAAERVSALDLPPCPAYGSLGQRYRSGESQRGPFRRLSDVIAGNPGKRTILSTRRQSFGDCFASSS